MSLTIAVDQDAAGRWTAAAATLPGTEASGATREEAVRKAEAAALRVLADRVEHGDPPPDGVFEEADYERYTPERIAEFLLNNAVGDDDYGRACDEVRALGLDPDTVPNVSPRGN